MPPACWELFGGLHTRRGGRQSQLSQGGDRVSAITAAVLDDSRC